METSSAFTYGSVLFTSILLFLPSPAAEAETLSGLLELKPINPSSASCPVRSAAPAGLVTEARPESHPEARTESRSEPCQFYLALKNQNLSLKIVPQGPSIKADLRKLKAGDFIIGQGSISGERVVLDAIESVGLQKLLGSWHTPDWQIYEFRDFHRLLLYKIEHKHLSHSARFAGPREYHYVLAPENGARFSIFLSDNTDVLAGSLEILDGRVSITVFNNETGDVAENISLSPVPLQ